MSHSTGAVKFPDGKIMFCEYNGTVDIMESTLYHTYDEMSNNWRSGRWSHCYCKLVCGVNYQDPVEVEIASTYGGCFYWKGIACATCKVLLDGFEPVNDRRGLPDWFPDKEKYTL